MKNILKLFLFLHIISLLIINYDALTVLAEKKTNFNHIINHIIPPLKKNKISKNIIQGIGAYENFLGSDRGFEFFSPNVSNTENKLIFIGNNNEQLYLLDSIEGNLKFYTFNSYINLFLANPTNRDIILKNICSHLFQKNNSINEINIFFISNTVSPLYNKNILPKKNKILIAKIKKNE